MAPLSWQAKWCFTRKHLARPWNQYAYFRRTVELPTKPRRAVVRISADARYTLYVNERRIHHGPARSFQQFQSYDTLDVTASLQPRRNAVCAIVHQFGIPTFQSIYRDISGFLMDGEIELEDGTSIPIHTPEGWLCRQAGAWRQDAARHSIQLGFQEHFDTSADSGDWLQPEFDPNPEDGWKPPWVAGPVGIAPWDHMEDRGVPLLADHVENFVSIVSQFVGQSERGYESSRDVYHLPLREPRYRDSGFISDPHAMLRNDPRLTTIQPPSADRSVGIVLDLGQYRTGHLMLDIADAAGGEMIDLIYAEEIHSDGFPLLVPESSHCQEATADRYRCRRGKQRWETFAFHGMRYAMLVFRNVTTPLRLRHVAIRQVHADVKNLGSFECSDEKLNRIWQVARETQRNCLFDAFVDCPWREQAMWWGDARVQSRVTLHAFGDLSILERGIRLMARSQADDGSLHSHPPADVPGHRLPDFMMTWVASLWDWHWHSGRTELVRECLPVMQRLFEFFDKHESDDGLIGSFDGWWVFLDWVDLHRGNYSAVLNMLYLQSLRHATAICHAVGDQANAARYEGKSRKLAASIETHFWEESLRVWRDGFDAQQSRPIAQVSQHANSLAILLDLQPEHREWIARQYLLKPAQDRDTKVLTGSPFFYAYILEAMIQAGLRGEAIDLIREKWGQMLDRGATTFWEMWDVTTQSRCHAWSSSPLYHISEQILGVMPIEPGWRKVRIDPYRAGLEFARGTVPSPLGPVRVEWESVSEDRLSVLVEIPPSMQADLLCPDGQSRSLAPGLHEFRV